MEQYSGIKSFLKKAVEKEGKTYDDNKATELIKSYNHDYDALVSDVGKRAGFSDEELPAFRQRAYKEFGFAPVDDENKAEIEYLNMPVFETELPGFEKYKKIEEHRSLGEGLIQNLNTSLEKVSKAPKVHGQEFMAAQDNTAVNVPLSVTPEITPEYDFEADIKRANIQSRIADVSKKVADLTSQLDEQANLNKQETGFISEQHKKVREEFDRYDSQLDAAIKEAHKSQGDIFTNQTGSILRPEDRRRIADLNDIKTMLVKIGKVVEAPHGDKTKDQLDGLMFGLLKSNTANDFFTLGVNEMLRNVNVKDAFDKQQKGEELKPEELALIDTYKTLLQYQNASQQNFGTTIGSGLQEMIPFIAQFALTSGAGNTAKQVVKEFIESRTKNAILGKVAGTLAKVGTQSVLMPYTAEEYARRTAPVLNEKGELAPGQGKFEAAWKSFATTAAEVFGEDMTDLSQKALRNHFVKKMSENPAAAQRLINKLGVIATAETGIPSVQSLPFELFGEEITGTLEAVIDQDGSFFTAESQKQLIALVTMAGGVASSVSPVMRYKTKNAWNKAKEELADIPDGNFTKAVDDATMNIDDPEELIDALDDLATDFNVSPEDYLKARNYVAKSIRYNQMSISRQMQIRQNIADYADKDGNITSTVIDGQTWYIRNTEDLGQEGKAIFAKDDMGNIKPFSSAKITSWETKSGKEVESTLLQEDELLEQQAEANDKMQVFAEENNLEPGAPINTIYGSGQVVSLNPDGTITAQDEKGQQVIVKPNEIIPAKESPYPETIVYNNKNYQVNGEQIPGEITLVPLNEQGEMADENVVQIPIEEFTNLIQPAPVEQSKEPAADNQQPAASSQQPVSDIDNLSPEEAYIELSKTDPETAKQILGDEIQSLKDKAKELRTQKSEKRSEKLALINQAKQLESEATLLEQLLTQPANSQQPVAKPIKPRKPAQLSKVRTEAMQIQPSTVREVVLQHFIQGGKINIKALQYIFGGTKGREQKSIEGERKARISYYSPTGQSIDEMAHYLWENNVDKTPNATDVDYRDQLVDIIQTYNSPTAMANDLVSVYKGISNEDYTAEQEQALAKEAYENRLDENLDKIADELENNGLINSENDLENVILQYNENTGNRQGKTEGETAESTQQDQPDNGGNRTGSLGETTEQSQEDDSWSQLDHVPFRTNGLNISEKATADFKTRTNAQNALIALQKIFNIPVQIIHSSEIPGNVGNRAKRMRVVPVAFYNNGTAYIISDMISSVSDMKKSYLHEAVLHHGLDILFANGPVTILGKKFNSKNELLGEVFSRLPEDIIGSRLKEYGKELFPQLFTEQKGKIKLIPGASLDAIPENLQLEIAEEALATLNEKDKIPSRLEVLLDSLWKFIKKLVGFSSKQFTRTELHQLLADHRNLVRQATNAVNNLSPLTKGDERSGGGEPQLKDPSGQANIKEGVDFVFEQNPELSSIGTPQQYSQYLDTIFPDSKVKNIVYHGTDNKFDVFDDKLANTKDDFIGYIPGHYFFNDMKSAEAYTENSNILPAIVNAKNPFKTGQYSSFSEHWAKFDYKSYDSVIGGYFDLSSSADREYFKERGFTEVLEYAIPNSEQIHILGSKQDIEGFKQFVSNSSEGVNSEPRFKGAYHGSPHSFDKFSTSFIGTGEGAQAYGWGLYFTDKENIARSYAELRRTDLRNLTFNDKPFIDVVPLDGNEYWDRYWANWLPASRDKEHFIEMVNQQYLDGRIAGPRSKRAKDFEKQKQRLIDAANNGEIKGWPEGSRNLYKVKIHGDKTLDELNFLRWDKPMSKENAEKIKEQLKKEYQVEKPESKSKWIYNNISSSETQLIGSIVYDYLNSITGKDKETSMFLLRAGIDGIVYPAEYTSKGSHEEAFNYVVFDENAIEIEEHIRFRTASENLVAIHNINPEGLINANKIGGLPMPSLAIINVENGFDKYGTISLIAGKEFIDPSKNRYSKVYGSDVYSARYPSLSYVIPESGNKKIIRKVNELVPAKLSSDIIHNIKSSIIEGGMRNLKRSDSAKLLFLAETKRPFEIKYNQAKYPESIKKTFIDNGWKNLEYYEINDNNEVKKQLTDLYFQKEGADEQLKRFLSDDGILNSNLMRNFINDVKVDIRDTGEVNFYDTVRDAEKYVRENNLEDEFESYALNLYNEIGVDEKIFRGFSNSGNRLYSPHTLENVLKEMKKDGIRGGEKFGYGAGSVRAQVTPQFKNLSEIQKNKDKIIPFEDNIKDEANNELIEVLDSIKKFYKYESNRFGYYDNAAEELVSLARRGYSDSFKPIDAESKKLVGDFLNKLANMPTEYFEAKINRGVSIAEFQYALIPDNSSKDIRDILHFNGVKTFEYTDKKDRLDKLVQVSEENNLRFRTAQTFYSPTEKALNQISQNKGTVEQFKAMLLKNGAKQAEMDWMGFDERFPDARKMITKADVQNWIDGNKVEVEEVVKGNNNWDGDELIQDGETVATLINNEDGTWSYQSDFSDGSETFDSKDEAKKEAELNTIGDSFSERGTKYHQYQLPGGSNYKEVLLTMPDRYKVLKDKVNREVETPEELMEFERLDRQIKETKQDFHSSHWDEPNILAHIRFNERTDSEGNKVLFIEEIQSDWAQKGKKEGFGDKGYSKEIIPPTEEQIANDNYEYTGVIKDKEGKIIKSFKDFSKPKVERLLDDSFKFYVGNTTPDMPFKQTPQWVNLALRRMIRYAAENGFDRIAWTTGEQQAERYDLSKQVKTVDAQNTKGSNKSYQWDLTVTDNNGNPHIYKITDDKELAETVGKDLAEKIIADNPNKWNSKSYTGLDLKVGGSGMKAFYDSIVPNAAKELGKKFGAKVEETEINAGNDINNDTGEYLPDNKVKVLSLPVTPAMQESALNEGMPLFRVAKNQSEIDEFIKDSDFTNTFYHRSPNRFSEFDKNKIASNTDAGWLGAGFYFYGDRNEAVGYGENEYAVKLNIQNPYFATDEENATLAELNDINESNKFSQNLIDEGYDAVYYNGNLRQEIVVFEPYQILIIPEEEDIKFRIEQQRSEVDTEPTEAQKEAGNYRKGHVRFDGFDISIENPKGSIRSGTDKTGRQWQQQLPADYGYFRGTVGKDKDHIDVFIGENPESDKIYVVDQLDPQTGKFDEHKVMLGFNDISTARKTYLAAFEKGWKGLGAITRTNKEGLKLWFAGNTKVPFSQPAFTTPEANPGTVNLINTLSGLEKSNAKFRAKEISLGKNKPMDKEEQLPFTNYLKSDDVKTGQPVTLTYLKNTEKAPYLGDRFGQDVEPSGFYFIQKEHNFPPSAGWIEGKITLNNPLVIPVTDETMIEYKRELSKKYKGKKNKALTNAIKADGYDGIITTKDGYLGEMVKFDFTPSEAIPETINKNELTSASLSDVGDGSTPPKKSGDNATESKNVSSIQFDAIHNVKSQNESKENISDFDIRGGIYNTTEYKLARKVQSILKERGIEKGFSTSETDFGNSIYFTVYGDNLNNPKLKIRISDHSVSNTDRVFNEQHESSKSDPERIANDIELAMYPERYNKIQTGVSYYSKWNNERVTEPVKDGKAWVRSRDMQATEKMLEGLNPNTARVISKTFLRESKSGNKIYDAVIERLNEVIEKPIYKYERKEELPETITINGKERSTRNSNGQFIHPTLEGIKNFWEWFGDSKVVDESGRPLVVYHGTNAYFTEFKSISGRYFFTDNKNVAERYRDDYVFIEDNNIGIKSGEYEQFKDQVIPNPVKLIEAYLNISNPKIKDYQGENWLNSPIENDIDKTKDGLIAKNIIDGAKTKATTYIVFSPVQIKSATGNNGDFNPDDPDIRFRAKPEEDENFLDNILPKAAKAYEEKQKVADFKKTVQNIREFWQDINLPIRKLEEEIIKRGGKLYNKAKPYRDINLSFGRMEELYRQFTESKMTPILEAIRDIIKEGKDPAYVLPYIIAKHAVERNRFMRMQELDQWIESNPDSTANDREQKLNNLSLKDYSGVKDFDKENKYKDPDQLAEEIIEEFEIGLEPETINNLWDKIGAATGQILDHWLKGSQISSKQYQTLKKQYKYFVPLRGWRQGAAKELRYNKGEGFGASLKHAQGRKTLADNPLAYIQAVAFKAIGERVQNEISNSLLNLVMTNYDREKFSDLYAVKKVYYIKSFQYNPDTQTNEEVWEPTLVKPDNAMFESGDAKSEYFKEHMKLRTTHESIQHEVIIHREDGDVAIVFPGKNLSIAQAFNRQNTLYEMFGKVYDATDLSRVAKVTGAFGTTNFMKGMFTSLNPVFPFTNFFRDVPEAAITMFIQDNNPALAKHIPSAMKTVYRKLAGKTGTELDEKLQEFYETGAATGYTHEKSPEQIEKDLNKELSRILRSNGLRGKSINTITGIYDIIGKWNQLFEDTTRFAVYLNSLEAGKSREDAAMDAKEASVNFNRKGKGTKLFDSVWAFFNPAIQGMQKNFKLAKDHPKRFWAVAGSVVMLGFLEALLNDIAGGDDDRYFDINDYSRQNYAIIGFGEKFVRIPLPQFWRGFHSLGVISYDMMKGETKVSDGIANILLNFMGGLSPIDIPGFWTDGEFSFAPIIPTWAKPVVEANITNRNFMGETVWKEPFTKALEKQLANSTLHKRNVNPAIRAVTDFVAKDIGGRYGDLKVDIRDGKIKTLNYWLDWNPSKIEHLITSYTGGTGKALSDITTTLTQLAVTDEEVDINNVPFINAFIRNTPDEKWEIISDWYDIKDIAGDYKAVSDYARKINDKSKSDSLDKSKYKQISSIVTKYDKQISKVIEENGLYSGNGESEVTKLMEQAINEIDPLLEN